MWSLGSLKCVSFFTKAFLCALLFHPTSNGSFWWICRYGGYNGKLASHISLSQRPDPKEKQVISLDQDVQVSGYFWTVVDETPLYEFSLPCNIFGMGCILFFFFFLTCLVGVWHTFFGYASFLFFFLTCLAGMWHTFFGYAFFISFCIAHTLWW